MAGFFDQFGVCVPCNQSSSLAWLIVFAVFVGVILLGMLFLRFRDVLPIDLLKVSVSMFQIIASANTA